MTANPNSMPPDPATGPKVQLPWEKRPGAEPPTPPPGGTTQPPAPSLRSICSNLSGAT